MGKFNAAVRGKVLRRPGTQVVAITWSPDEHDVCIAYADGFIIRGGFAGVCRTYPIYIPTDALQCHLQISALL